MKANQFANNEKAEVGIGTMIVFIATILVAAIAAGVLISTSQKLQDKSTRTGNDATNNVGSSLTVVDIVGTRAAGDIHTLDIYVTLAPGAEPLDLDGVRLHYNDGKAVTIYARNANITATTYTTEWVRGAGTDGVMQAGDFVRLRIGAAGNLTIGLETNTKVDVALVPNSGNPVNVGFTTPSSYAGNTQVDLF